MDIRNLTISLLLIGLVVGLLSACQSLEPEVAAYDGKTLYLQHCVRCHGEEGAGDGPVAIATRQTVPDLRSLRLSNELEVINAIDGRDLREGHSTADMPVWGWAFRQIERSENDVQARLQAVAKHVLSMQYK